MTALTTNYCYISLQRQLKPSVRFASVAFSLRNTELDGSWKGRAGACGTCQAARPEGSSPWVKPGPESLFPHQDVNLTEKLPIWQLTRSFPLVINFHSVLCRLLCLALSFPEGRRRLCLCLANRDFTWNLFNTCNIWSIWVLNLALLQLNSNHASTIFAIGSKPGVSMPDYTTAL